MTNPKARFCGCLGLCSAFLVAMLFVFPGAPVLQTMIMLLVIAAISAACYRLMCPPEALGEYTLLAVWTLLGFGLIVNVWYFTTVNGGTIEAPVLFNDDAATVWRQLRKISENHDSFSVYRMHGYASLLYMLSLGTVPRIHILLGLNAFAIILTIIISGAIAQRLCRRGASVAMLLLACICYFVASGVILIKDAAVCLVMALWLYAVSCKSYNKLDFYLLALVAIGLGAWIRPHLLPFMALAVLVIAIDGFRRRWPAALAMIAAIILIYVCLDGLGIESKVTGSSFDIEGGAPSRLAAYRSVLADYPSLSLWQKLLALPFTLTVQYLTPLPWAFTRDIPFGPSNILAHFSYPWYAIGGIILIFFVIGYRKAPKKVYLLAVFGALACAVTALVTGGTVSRYCLPWLPAFIPAASWVISSRIYKTKQFRTLVFVYVLLLVLALCVVFFSLSKYSPGGWIAV